MDIQNKRHILLVNDKRHEVEFLQNKLQHATNYTILIALNGKMALEMVTEGEFPVIVADLMLNDIAGSELLNSISPETQLILISEKATIDLAVDAMKKGAFDFVTRPFSHPHLLQVVNRANCYYDSLVENKRLRAEIKGLCMQSGTGHAVIASLSLKETERALIAKTLHECHGNKHLAAKLLKIPRSSLYSKIRKHGIRTEESESFYSINREDSALVQDIPA